MLTTHTKIVLSIMIAILVVVAFAVLLIVPERRQPPTASPMRSYPAEGAPYSSDKIRIQQPRPNSFIENGEVIIGEAVGTWFFEASFPINLVDTSGKIVASTTAHALDNWMTTKLVRFTATLNFTSYPAKIETWSLVFQKDNPSGLPENDDSVKIPVLVSPAE